MNITEIPFNKFLGISLANNKEYLLQLDARTEYTNHLGTVHAAALFALAEGSGGQFLLNCFPGQAGDVIPVVRKAEVVFKKPASGLIVSTAHFKDDTIENIQIQLNTKKRASLITTIELLDAENNKVFIANFEWFVTVKK